MALKKSSYDYEELLACGRGELFGPGNAQLPAPPMLMLNRIIEISDEGGVLRQGPDGRRIRRHAGTTGSSNAIFSAIRSCRVAWGSTALWQMLGFYLGWLGGAWSRPGARRRRGEAHRYGAAEHQRCCAIRWTSSASIMRRLVLGVADGVLEADGETIYTTKDLAGRPIPERRGDGVKPVPASLPDAAKRSQADRRISTTRRLRRTWSRGNLAFPELGFSRRGAVEMRRVVVTGLGVVSSIGSNAQEVSAALREGRSGIVFAPDYAELGFRCHVHGAPNGGHRVAGRQARAPLHGRRRRLELHRDDAGDHRFRAGPDEVSHERTGLIMGSGGPSTKNLVAAADITREKGVRPRSGPFMVPRAMSSTNSATLATPFKIKGVNYSITSACSTSAHCIGAACRADPVGQAGRDVRRRRRRARLDAFGACSTPWARCPRSSTITPEIAPRAPSIATGTVS